MRLENNLSIIVYKINILPFLKGDEMRFNIHLTRAQKHHAASSLFTGKGGERIFDFLINEKVVPLYMVKISFNL